MLFQQPSRASSLAALYGKLAEWEALGVEVESGGHKVEDWVRVCALRQLVPKELAEDLITRPECRDFRPAMAFVRSRLSLLRAVTQAAAVSKRSDMDLGNLEAPAAGGGLGGRRGAAAALLGHRPAGPM